MLTICVLYLIWAFRVTTCQVFDDNTNDGKILSRPILDSPDFGAGPEWISKRHPISCSWGKMYESSANCTCEFGQITDPLPMKEVMKQHEEILSRASRFHFEDCSFDIQENDLINFTGGYIEFKTNRFNHSKITVGERGFQFLNIFKVEVKFSRIDQLELKKYTFGPQVTLISITRGSNLIHFSSDAFADMTGDATVLIKNSYIVSGQSSSRVASLHNFTMKNVVTGELNAPSTLNIMAPNVHLANVTTFPSVPNAIQFPNSSAIVFQGCHLRLGKGALSARAHHILFKENTFDRPEADALLGFSGMDDSSQLTFTGNTFSDASPGFLVSQFPQITFELFTSSACWCGQSESYLYGLSSLNPGYATRHREEELVGQLRNATFCKNETSYEMFQLVTFCLNHSLGSGDPLMILFVSLFFVVVVIAGSLLAYAHHDKLKRKYEMMKQWTLVLPATAYAKETIEKFDMEKASSISRPKSEVFTIDASHANAWVNANPNVGHVILESSASDPVYENVVGTPVELMSRYRVQLPLTTILEEDEFLRCSAVSQERMSIVSQRQTTTTTTQ